MRPFIAMLVLSLLMVGSAWAACSEPTTLDALIETSMNGEFAFATMDHAKLLVERDRALEILKCLGEPITPSEAAAFHRLMGLTAFTKKDEAQVLAEFHAARKLKPGYEIPERVAPQGHKLIDLYESSAAVPDGEFETVYPPERGYVTVGGVRGALRASKSPAIVQVFDRNGTIFETNYIASGDALPVWGPPPMDIALQALQERQRDHKPWIVASVVAAGIAGVFYTVAISQKNQFTNLETSDDQLASLRERANTFGAFAIGTGAVAVGFGGVSITLGAINHKNRKGVPAHGQ